MSFLRTPPNEAEGAASRPSTTAPILPLEAELIPNATLVDEPVCEICKIGMAEQDDCLIITNCSHSFHRACIENFLSNATECPTCKRSCQLVDPKKIYVLNKQDHTGKSSIHSRGRGAMRKTYNTRAQAKNLCQDNQRSFVDSNASERVNRFIIAGIRAYLKSDHRLWDENLSKISCALRNSYHQAIQTTPYHAMFGLDMITHGNSYDLLKNLQLLNEPSYHLARDDKLTLIRGSLRKHIRAAYEVNRTQYNLRIRPQSFQKGQEIFRRNFVQSSSEKKFNAKLSPLFVKCRIREKLGKHYYLIDDLQGKLVGTYHAKDLRT